MVENLSGRKVKTLHTDNGGEYTSREFELYLTREGIHHETTIPHTPEQNGEAERQTRTLIEGVQIIQSCHRDSRLRPCSLACISATKVPRRHFNR